MTSYALSLDTGTLGYRQWWNNATDSPVVVLLHGISSGSGSWENLAPELPGYRVLAWDAPGYGISHGLTVEQPTAADYAKRLEAWLNSMGIDRHILVGHSLGAMMAAAYTRRWPERVSGLLLADPAEGYGHADPAERERVYHSRWPDLETLGSEAYACERAPRLLRPGVGECKLARVRRQMQRLTLDGFRRANWMLANDALLDYLPLPEELPVQVICGDQDRITPPERVEALAREIGRPYRVVPEAGHASYIDNPAAFAERIHALASQTRPGSAQKERIS